MAALRVYDCRAPRTPARVSGQRALSQNRRAIAAFSSKGHDLFASVQGSLSISRDRDVIDRLWNPFIAAWFDGKDDPKLVLLRFDLDDAEIWTADPGIKGMLKLATGMTMKEGELGEHAKVAL